jgi:molecular chaperone GrpE
MPNSHGSDPAEERRQQTAQAEPDADTPAPDEGDSGAAELNARLARTEDRLKRALADLDNYRKRSVREVDRRVDESRDALLRDWLEPIDNVERALRVDSDSPLAAGVRGVLDQMESLLARHGVVRSGEAGERFDPNRHEAIGVVDTDAVPDRTVTEVVRAGYTSGDRVLRPAQVVVARNPEREG